MKLTSFLPIALILAAATLRAEDFKKVPPKPVDLVHDKNLYLVGYAHLDTQWRWTYVDTIRDFVRNTMEQNFALFEKYPNYTFNFTGSRRYEFMKEYYPEEYAQVKKYVAEGRWYPAGSSVDENDANVPSLESMQRHFLYGNHFFQREFKKESEDYLLPDCFGFPASLPTVLAHGGIKGFSTQKLTWGSAVGIPFNVGTWFGPDGSSVLATLNPGGYGTQVTEDLSKSQSWLKRINEDGAKSGIYADYKYFGTGDRGGACKPETAAWIEKALQSGGPVRVIEGRSDQIFRDLTPQDAAKLPTYKGELELVNHSAGSISSEAYMKRWNRKNEQLAAAAEGAATTAAWLGAFKYPYEPIYQAWDLVLGSQMHDIMPGTSVPKAYEFSWNDEVLALNLFASVTESASAAVLAQMDTSAQGIPVAVYNPLGFAREDPVEAIIPAHGNEAVTAYDASGQAVPTQVLSHEADTLRVLFIAKAPSLGYAIYDLRPASSNPPSALKVSENSLENFRYRIALNSGGDVSSIFDKSLNKELLSGPMRLLIQYENPARYPAWNMDYEDRLKPPRSIVSGPAKLRIVENGPARVALEVERTTENSTFKQQVRLSAGSPGDRVELLDHIDWRASEASLRTEFPLTASNPEASFDDKVGITRRGNDNPKCFELPLQQWMDLTATDGSFGVSILNDSKYASDKPDDHTLRQTMLYTPGTRGGTPDQGSQDQGRHEILLGLAAHPGDWTQGQTPAQAARLNQPLRAFLPLPHPGSIGRSFSMLSVNNPQVQIMAVKQAEDSDEIVVRLKELTGKPASGISLHFAAPIKAAREVDGQEHAVGSAGLKDETFTFDMKGFGLRAFAFKLAPPSAKTAAVESQPISLGYDTDVVSARSNRTDGAMDATGGAYPAELFPGKLQQEGVEFSLGPVSDGAKNALTAKGQTLNFPAGNFTRVHLLVAADGDVDDQIKIGEAVKSLHVPNWTGYVGQWDNRIWEEGTDGENINKPPVGLVPGYIKGTAVAWFATHHNSPAGDAYYQYSYLFQVSYDLAPGISNIVLPTDLKLRVFAASVSREPSAAPAAAPLYDTLADHQSGGAPIITQDGQTFSQATKITLLPPLYHRPHGLHYTLDGSQPTASSPVYEAPFYAADTVKISAREIDSNSNPGPIATGQVNIHDTTPPQLVSALSEGPKSVDLQFTEPLQAGSATNPENYILQPVVPISQIKQSADGLEVKIALAKPLTPGLAYQLTVRGLKDSSPAGNVIAPVTRLVNAENVVYSLPAAEMPSGAVSAPAPGLPVEKDDNWTINLLVKATVRPTVRVLIAGFGATDEEPGEGQYARYFAIYQDGIRFWYAGNGHDVVTNSPLDLGHWQMLTATYNGKSIDLYKDGDPIGSAKVGLKADSQNVVKVGPPAPWDQQYKFAGSVKNFTIRLGALSAKEVKELYKKTKPVE